MKMTAKKEEDPDNEEEDLDQLSHIIDPQEVGPDGVNLWRNMSDVMNNFFINIVSRPSRTSRRSRTPSAPGRRRRWPGRWRRSSPTSR